MMFSFMNGLEPEKKTQELIVNKEINTYLKIISAHYSY